MSLRERVEAAVFAAAHHVYIHGADVDDFCVQVELNFTESGETVLRNLVASGRLERLYLDPTWQQRVFADTFQAGGVSFGRVGRGGGGKGGGRASEAEHATRYVSWVYVLGKAHRGDKNHSCGACRRRSS